MEDNITVVIEQGKVVDEEESLKETFILEELDKHIVVAKDNDKPITKFNIMKDEVKRGIFNSPLVRSIIKEYKSTKKMITVSSQKQESQLTLEDIIQKYNFYLQRKGRAVWYYQPISTDEFGNRKWVTINKDALLCSFPPINVFIPSGDRGVHPYVAFDDFNQRLIDSGRHFIDVRQSYTDKEGYLNIMNKEFCSSSEDGSDDYHWIFDAVIETLSGSKKDTDEFNSFQKTLWSKYLHPDNPFLPSIFIKDLEGRAAKGLVSNTFLKRLFNGGVADNCTVDHITGKFNSYIAGKPIIVMNETKREKVDMERIKAFLGSPTIVVEEKFFSPYSADNVSLMIAFTNDVSGSVTLSGTASDERYSIFSANRTIYEVLGEYLFANTGKSFSKVEIKKWLQGNEKESGQNLLFSKEQVGKWIVAMALKFGDCKHVEPVHGEEYKKLIDRQRGAWTETVSEVFDDPNFSHIKSSTLFDLIRERNKGEILPGRNRMREEIVRFCKDKGLNVTLKEQGVIKNSCISSTVRRPVWAKGPFSHNTFTDNDSDYFEVDAYGRRIWK